MENLVQLEALCGRLYNSQDTTERVYAENTLRCFAQDSSSMPQLEYILENSRNSYAILFASSSLLKHVTEDRLPIQQRLQIRNHVISYLASRGANLEQFVLSSLILLVCRVTKYSWLDDEKFQDIVNESVNFLNQPEASHYAIGLKILQNLVMEINQPTQGLSLMQNRKVATSFRDKALLQIYGISLTSLLGLQNDAQHKLQELALALSLQCLSFDFLGMSADESSDEIGTTQIPATWKSVIEEPSTVKAYFDSYAVAIPPVSKLALECLVRLVCVKRSIFTNDATRMQFLTSCMMGTKDILETGRGLNHRDNYHEFCRLIGRFKLNFQLQELASVECFSAWINLISDFTLKSLQSWKWTRTGVYYLLGLWSRMVTSLPFVKNLPDIHLDEFTPKILEGFVSSRFDSLQDDLSDDVSEDPLDKIELMQDQLDFVPYLCRFQYGRCSAYLTNIIDPILQEYMDGTKLQDYVASSNITLVEAKLTWMVHIVGATMRIKSYAGGESNEVIDAELSARVFQLINVMDTGSYVQRYGELSRQRLELAVLSFFQFFRKTYVGDQAMNSSKQLYVRLSELLGLHDHLLVLNVIVQKLAKNLKFCSESEEVLDQTLALFLEMSTGYMTGKMLLKLDTIQYITANHSRENFLFLKDYSSRRRTTFYYTIGSLVFTEESVIKFKQAMDFFQQVFVNLESIPDSVFRDEAVKCALVGLMRDLRGITMATNSRRSYGLLFDWLYPTHMSLLLKAIATWADCPEVTTPLLKFVAELVKNKAQRITFDQSSPNGILLFREVSKLLVTYGSRILTLPAQKDAYQTKYKGIWICLVVLTRAITGNYVNFGVFELYGDRALDDALDIALKMVLSIPAADILAYRKVSKAYYSFVEGLLVKLIKVTFNLDGTTFIYIIRSLHSGLQLLDSEIISQCANSIDYLATCYFDNLLKGESPAPPGLLKFGQHISDCGDYFLDILKTLFELVLFEDSATHWGLSRPMLSLILLGDEMFTKLKSRIITSQPVDKQERIHRCFDMLMEEVTRSLESANRDKFTRNLGRFRKEFRGM